MGMSGANIRGDKQFGMLKGLELVSSIEVVVDGVCYSGKPFQISKACKKAQRVKVVVYCCR